MPSETVRILGIAGSLRRLSFNMGLLRAAEDVLPPNATFTSYERLADIPPYNQDVEEQVDPGPVRDFKAHIAAADCLLIATPEYNYSVPGVLKNAIDWASRPPSGSVLNGKPIAIMGATSGMMGTTRAQSALRQSFVFTRSLVMVEPEVYVSRAGEKFDRDGSLKDIDTRDRLGKLVEALVLWTQRLRRSAEVIAA